MVADYSGSVNVPHTRILLGVLVAAGAGYWLFVRSPAAQASLVDAGVAVKNALIPRGLRNNNPGNLRTIARNPWAGQVGGDADGYGVYDAMQSGARAAAKQLLKYQRAGLNTVRKLIATWAPSVENNTEAYIAAVAKALGVGADQAIDVNANLEALAWAIFKHECGWVSFSRAESDQWVRLP